MNKIKATKRDMRENYFIIGIGYCQADWLLDTQKPIAYSVGQYGWACDYYEFDGVVISTGYSPLNNKNTLSTYKMIKSYNDKAGLILSNGGNYEQKRNAVKLLLSEFIEQAKQNAKVLKQNDEK
jgi:hypothetical protein